MVIMNSFNAPSEKDGNLSGDLFYPSTSKFRRHSLGTLSSNGRPWYHGELSRIEAENLLSNSEAGSFLVRLERPSRYFLSFLGTDKSVEHLPITQLSRQFYFNGLRFSSLSDIVQTFADSGCGSFSGLACSTFSQSDAMSEEDSERFICTESRKPSNNSDEVCVIAGDVLAEIRRSSSGWVSVKNERTGSIGCIPSRILTKLVAEGDPEELVYFHETVDNNILQQISTVGPGSFLLRRSSRGENSYALIVKTNVNIEKFLIVKSSDGQCYFLAGRPFHSIDEIIDRYSRIPITRDIRLTHAVPNYYISSLSNTEHANNCLNAANVPTETEFCSRFTADTRLDNQFGTFADDVVNHNSATHTVASIQAMRKSREDKSWKTCCVRLSDDPNGGCHLIITENSSNSRIRATFDLSYCSLYCLHETVFCRDGSVFISQHDVDEPGMYLQFRPFDAFVQWMHLLRPRVLGLQTGAAPVMIGLHFEPPKVSHLALLYLYIDKFRSDSLKLDGNYSASCAINGVKVCSTTLLSPNRASTPSLVFDSSFILPFVTPGRGSFQLSLYQHQGSGKKGKLFGVSSLLALPNETDVNVHLEDGFSFRAVRSRIRVYSLEFYKPVLDWLMCPTEIEALTDHLTSQQRALLCESIASHFLSDPAKLLHVLRVVELELFTNSDESNVMRQDSFGTTLLTQSLRVTGKAQLEDLLETAAVTSLKNNEVDAIVSCMNDLIATNSLVLHILYLLVQLSTKVFDGKEHVARRVLSNAFVLRFVNPVVISVVNVHGIGHLLAKRVQAVAKIAAAQNPTGEDETNASTQMREFFNNVIYANLEAPTSTVKNPGCDWLATICHILYVGYVSSTNQPKLPEDLKRLLFAHQTSAS